MIFGRVFRLSSSPLACALQKSLCGLHSRRRAMLWLLAGGGCGIDCDVVFGPITF